MRSEIPDCISDKKPERALSCSIACVGPWGSGGTLIMIVKMMMILCVLCCVVLCCVVLCCGTPVVGWLAQLLSQSAISSLLVGQMSVDH